MSAVDQTYGSLKQFFLFFLTFAASFFQCAQLHTFGHLSRPEISNLFCFEQVPPRYLDQCCILSWLPSGCLCIVILAYHDFDCQQKALHTEVSWGCGCHPCGTHDLPILAEIASKLQRHSRRQLALVLQCLGPCPLALF